MILPVWQAFDLPACQSNPTRPRANVWKQWQQVGASVEAKSLYDARAISQKKYASNDFQCDHNLLRRLLTGRLKLLDFGSLELDIQCLQVFRVIEVRERLPVSLALLPGPDEQLPGSRDARVYAVGGLSRRRLFRSLG